MSVLLQSPSVEKGIKGAYTIRVCERIQEVDAAEWDSIIGPDDLQATHRFIETCQSAEVENALYRHLMIYDGDRLVCVASLSLMLVSLDLLSKGMTRAAIRSLRAWRPNFLRVPLLLCGLPVSFGNSCIRWREGADSARLLEMVAGVMDSVAQDLHASVLCFKEFRDEEADALKTLTRYGFFRAQSLPGCSMPIAWRSFEDYVKSMRAGYRRQLMATLRVRREAGLTVRVMEDFGAECARIHGLYEAVMDGAEFQLERLNAAFFEKLNANFGADSRAILLERDGELLSAAIMLYTRRVATFLLVGINYEHNREYHSYFNIVIEVIREAINAGAETLELGQTSYDLKGRLGGATTGRHLYLKHRNGWLNPIFRTASGLLFSPATVPGRRVFRKETLASRPETS
ncbi:MAG TPA: GNAT family N-acetyltransferase [Pyrinomonadaceae bacterium]|jgi:predicted N-acyltransferase|nr:GNAT family N-acetyltransferase [Pyrinomonadaceae bacterium]